MIIDNSRDPFEVQINMIRGNDFDPVFVIPTEIPLAGLTYAHIDFLDANGVSKQECTLDSGLSVSGQNITLRLSVAQTALFDIGNLKGTMKLIINNFNRDYFNVILNVIQ